MRKTIVLLWVALWALSASAQHFGILVNGQTYYAGTKVDEFEGFTQYLAHVSVKSGDVMVLYNAETKDKWVVDLNKYSEKGFERAGNHYTTTNTGCYDFYMKLKWEQDELYIGPLLV